MVLCKATEPHENSHCLEWDSSSKPAYWADLSGHLFLTITLDLSNLICTLLLDALDLRPCPETMAWED